MATPRVFISSTCYDLKYIRENLKYFVSGLGYEAVLSEEGDVFYNPRTHTQESCLKEIENCQMFVLIVGGRFGGNYKKTDKSITNMEYQCAAENKIPVFALVEQSVYNEHHVYERNKENENVEAEKIKYPAVDSTKIFDFINQVRTASIDNDIVPFSDFNQMSEYLKKQWAGMMYSFLTEQSKESERKAVNSLLSDLKMLGDKSQELLRFITVKVSEEEGPKKIDRVEAKAVIERFLDVIYSKFYIGHSSVREQILIDISECDIFPELWPAFLIQLIYFEISETASNKERNGALLFITETHTFTNINIGYKDSSGEEKWVFSTLCNYIQEKYKEFTSLDRALRDDIFREMIEE